MKYGCSVAVSTTYIIHRLHPFHVCTPTPHAGRIPATDLVTAAEYRLAPVNRKAKKARHPWLRRVLKDMAIFGGGGAYMKPE